MLFISTSSSSNLISSIHNQQSDLHSLSLLNYLGQKI